MAKLNGAEIRTLRGAMLDTFTSLEDWEGLLQLADHNLAEVSLASNLRGKAQDVIVHANDEGWLVKLLQVAAAEREDLAPFQDVVKDMLEVLEPALARGESPPLNILTIAEPLRMELVRVEDGNPLFMGTTAEQVDYIVAHDQWAEEVQQKGWFDREQPPSTVPVAPFAIGRYPVTNAQYQAFTQAKPHPVPEHWGRGIAPPGKEDHPVVNVSWRDAVAFTVWLSAQTGMSFRLPNEGEWEKAARGANERLWPWGDEWDGTLANCSPDGPGDTTPVGQYSPRGDSPYGCADMAGNVWEWCLTKWRDRYGTPPDDSLEGDDQRVIRGGSYGLKPVFVRCASRSESSPDARADYIGFRVAVSI